MRKELQLDGREIVLLGTSHVSEESRQRVKEEVEALQPDLVAVELDEKRLESLREESGWKDLDVAAAMRDGRGHQLALNLLLGIMQRRIGGSIEPGREMLEAVELADERGIEVALVDRDLEETLKRLRQELGVLELGRLLLDMVAAPEDMEPEEMLEQVNLDSLVDELGSKYPSIRRVLLDERNAHMASRISELEFKSALVVVGAAHVEGLLEQLEEPGEVPHPRNRVRLLPVVKYGIPLLVLAALPYLYLTSGFSELLTASAIWIGLNGVFAAAGALAARSHPLTVVGSFLAAPLTSLYPLLGAGMVAAYLEAKLRPPTVGDLEDLPLIDSYSSLWGNQAGKVLLTFMLVTLGSALATFLGGAAVLSLLF